MLSGSSESGVANSDNYPSDSTTTNKLTMAFTTTSSLGADSSTAGANLRLMPIPVSVVDLEL
jgi:hypothetical protein